jgi:4-hydroxy-3-methylbut-2-enyl diphosphate reductase IspH
MVIVTYEENASSNTDRLPHIANRNGCDTEEAGWKDDLRLATQVNQCLCCVCFIFGQLKLSHVAQEH